jgi:hypothetical protein
MALTAGSGPLSERRAGSFNFEVTAPGDHSLYLEDSPRRVRVVFGGETVADSRRVKLLHETGHLPVYYFPEEDVRMDLLEPTDHTTHCPFKGDASFVGGSRGASPSGCAPLVDAGSALISRKMANARSSTAASTQSIFMARPTVESISTVRGRTPAKNRLALVPVGGPL